MTIVERVGPPGAALPIVSGWRGAGNGREQRKRAPSEDDARSVNRISNVVGQALSGDEIEAEFLNQVLWQWRARRGLGQFGRHVAVKIGIPASRNPLATPQRRSFTDEA